MPNTEKGKKPSFWYNDRPVFCPCLQVGVGLVLGSAVGDGGRHQPPALLLRRTQSARRYASHPEAGDSSTQ